VSTWLPPREREGSGTTGYHRGARESLDVTLGGQVYALRPGATVVEAAGLPAVHGFLFVILRLQDHSLLIGTTGLFVSLGLVVYVTRNIDWHASDNR
jgi:inner membrane protein